MSLRRMILSFILLSTVMVYTGCDSSKSPAAVAGDSAVDTNYLKLEDVKKAEGESRFGYKFEKGDKFTYKIAFVNTVSQETKIDTVMKQTMDQQNVLVIDFEVKDVDKDTIAEVEVSTKSIYVKSEMNGEKKEYKTGDKLDSLKKLDFGFYEAITTNSFFARIDKRGNIREIFRVDKIVEAVLPQGKDSIPAQQKEMAADEIKNNLKGMIMQVFRSFSPGTLKANETFRDVKPPVNDPSGMYQLLATQLYTLTEKGKFNGSNLSVIEAGYDASYNFNPELAKQGIKVDKSVITGGGKVFYNDDQGKLQKSKTNLIEEVAFSGKIPDKAGKMTDFTSVKKSRVVNVVERIK